MDKRDWFILKTVFEEKNLTRASEKLYVSQPSLSYRIKKIEEFFNVKLFIKSRRGLNFTAEGEYLVKYANNMIQKLQETRDVLKNMDNEVTGTLRLGVSSNFALYILPTLLRTFSDKFPKVNFKLDTMLSTEVMGLLSDESVHAAIVRSDYPWSGEKDLLKEENLYIISSTEISLSELPNYKMIQYTTDQSLKNTIETWWNERFIDPPTVEMELNRLGSCIEMVKNGFGYAIVPEICLKKGDNLFTKEIKYKNDSPVLRQTWLMYSKQSEQLNMVKYFIDFMKEWDETILDEV